MWNSIFELLFDFKVDRNWVQQSLNEMRDDIKGFTQRVRDETAIELSLKSWALKAQLDDVRRQLRVAKKDWDKLAEIDLNAKADRLQQSLTQAKRELRNYVRTWSKDISVLGKNFNKVNKTIEQQGNIITRTLGKLKTWLWPIWGLLAWAFAFEGIRRFTERVFNLTSQVEQATVAFTTLLGSEEKALSLLKDIDEFAATTPFNKLQIVENTQKLLAFGFEWENVIGILRTIWDAVSAVGWWEEELGGLIRAFGQIQTKGKLVQQELNQIAERWVPVFEILRDELGLTQDQLWEVGKQGITAAEGLEAIFNGIDKRFGGSLEKQSQTLQGKYSNLIDKLELKMAEFGATVDSVFWWVIDGISNAIDSVTTESINTIWSFIVAVFESLKTVLGSMLDLVNFTFEQISVGVGAAMELVQWQNEETTSYLTGTRKDFFLVFALWLRGITWAFAIVVKSVMWAFDFMQQWWDATAKLLVNAFALAVVSISKTTLSGIAWLIDKALSLIDGLIGKINNVLGTDIGTIWFSAKGLVDWLFEWATETLTGTTKAAFAEFKAVAADSFSWVKWEIDDLVWDIENIGNSFKNAWKSTTDYKALAQSLFWGGWGGWGGGLEDDAKGAADAVKEIWDQIKEATDTSKDFEKALDKVEKATENVEKAQEDYADEVRDGKNRIKNDLKEVQAEYDKTIDKIEETRDAELDRIEKTRAEDKNENIYEFAREQAEELADIEREIKELKEEQNEVDSEKRSEIREEIRELEEQRDTVRNNIEELKKLGDENGKESIENIIKEEKARAALTEQERALYDFKQEQLAIDEQANAERDEKIAKANDDIAIAEQELADAKRSLELQEKVIEALNQVKFITKDEIDEVLGSEVFQKFDEDSQKLLQKLLELRLKISDAQTVEAWAAREAREQQLLLEQQIWELQQKNIADAQEEYDALIGKVAELQGKWSDILWGVWQSFDPVNAAEKQAEEVKKIKFSVNQYDAELALQKQERDATNRQLELDAHVAAQQAMRNAVESSTDRMQQDRQNYYSKIVSRTRTSVNAMIIEYARLISYLRQVISLQAQASSWRWFAWGGYTWDGGVNQVAWLVHRWEYVIPQRMVKRYSWAVSQLESARLKWYAEWGHVQTNNTSRDLNIAEAHINRDVDMTELINYRNRKS